MIFVRRQERFGELWGALELPKAQAYLTMQAEAIRAMREDSSRQIALLALGRSALQLGRPTEALEHYRRYMAADPDNLEAQAAVTLLPKRLNP